MSEQEFSTILWTPGDNLDAQYPIASDKELESAWQQYNPDGPARSLQGVYGVYTPPNHKITGIASVDLCEVVRDTVGAIHAATGVESDLTGVNFYSTGTWYDPTTKGVEYEKSVVNSIAQTLMSEGYVQPVQYGAAIAAFLRNWRRQGIYTVANTSTLPGCELGTIRHTLGRDLPGGFDALVLPRNHDGSGTLTKAGALALLAEEVIVDLAEVPFVHIDDAAHHIEGFSARFSGSRMQLFVPKHGANAHLPAELHSETPFEAFVKADQYFASEGVVHAR